MFTKKHESIMLDEYSKYYTSDYEMIDIVQMVENGPRIVKQLRIDDEADIGLKMFGGNYSFDGFYEAYKTYGTTIDKVRIYFEDVPASMSVYQNGGVSILTKDNSIEINNLLNEKKKIL